jgi:GNAT superfamily N-acetyltransferase
MAAVQAAEAIERAALADLYGAAAATGLTVRPVGDATLLLAADGPALMNRLVLGRPGGSCTDAELDDVTAVADAADLPWAVSVRPDADRGLAPRLAARGFRPGYAWMKLVRGAEPPRDAATALRVEPAGARDGVALAEVASASFGLGPSFGAALAALPGRPGWHCFLAWHGRIPVATGVCFVRGEAAWLGVGATLPAYRRWGAHRALLSARIRAAAAAGARELYVETGERVAGRPDQSYRNLLHAGFRELYRRPNLVCPGFDERAAAPRGEAAAHRAGIG